MRSARGDRRSGAGVVGRPARALEEVVVEVDVGLFRRGGSWLLVVGLMLGVVVAEMNAYVAIWRASDETWVQL